MVIVKSSIYVLNMILRSMLSLKYWSFRVFREIILFFHPRYEWSDDSFSLVEQKWPLPSISFLSTDRFIEGYDFPYFLQVREKVYVSHSPNDLNIYGSFLEFFVGPTTFCDTPSWMVLFLDTTFCRISFIRVSLSVID